MPQPLKNQGAEYRPNPIADRPEAAAALANAIAVWNLFEWDLTIAYSIALGFYLPGIQGWEPPNHPMGFDIMGTVAGLGTRLDLMEVALERVAPHLSEEFAELRKEIRKRAGKRAALAHGHWGINDLFPNDLIRSDDSGFARWTPNDFQDCADAFNELRATFQKFWLILRDFAKERKDLRPPSEFLEQEAE